MSGLSGWGESFLTVSNPDRNQGLTALQYWYEDVKMADLGISPDQVVQYYDSQSPAFIEGLGAAIRTGALTPDRLITAMEDVQTATAFALAEDDPLSPEIYFPHYTSFFDAVAGTLATTPSKLQLDDVTPIMTGIWSDLKKWKMPIGIAVGGSLVGYLLLKGRKR